MDMWLVVSYVGLFAVGVFIGYKINDWVIRKTFAQMIEEAGLADGRMDQFIQYWAAEMGEQVSDQREDLRARLEKIGDQIYCYNKDTNEFLGQGRDREELIAVLTERIGSVTLLVNAEDGADYLKETV
jgi:hypothetical protein